MKYWFLLEFELSRHKLSKSSIFQFFVIFCLDQITIFGAKIQIIQVNLAFKKISKIIAFLLKMSKSQFWIFLKIDFWETIWDILPVCNYIACLKFWEISSLKVFIWPKMMIKYFEILDLLWDLLFKMSYLEDLNWK